MKATLETIGNTSILIQALDQQLDVVGSPEGTSPFEDSGISEKVVSAYSEIKVALREIASDIGKEFATIAEAIRPNQLEMEFNVGISVEGKAGIDKIIVIGLGGTGEYSCKVKMSWDLK